jgi:excisionase family DNA binding protein
MPGAGQEGRKGKEKRMEKICIAKLRKGMAYPGQPDEAFEQKNRTGGERRLPGCSFEAGDGKGSGGRRTDATDRTVSLLLTQEQMTTLRSNRRLTSSLSSERAKGFAAVQHRDEPIVIKFEFESLPPVRLLKVEEVIQMLRISKSSLNKIVRQGMLKSYKFGRLRRIMLTDILSYLEDHREATVTQPQASESKPSSTVFVQQILRKEE